MSRKLNMTIYNASDSIIKSYEIHHEWDGHNEYLKGENLEKSAFGNTMEITSGYTQFDYYTVHIIFDRKKQHDVTTHFYCNSSSSDNNVVIRIKNKSCNCEYYKDSNPTSSCDNKHWSSIF